MPLATINVEKFLGLNENPLYSQKPGVLKTCVNFRVTPDGMLEARGGTEKFLPSGGSATAPISGGFYTGAHEHPSPVGVIMRFDGVSTYSGNLALQAYFDIFAGTAVGNRIYFISQYKLTRIQFNIGVAGTGAYTVNWKFLDTSAVAQTLTGVTEDFKATGIRTVSFVSPPTIGKNTVNNCYGYVYYAETATAVVGTIPKNSTSRVNANWIGTKELYLGSSNGASATSNGTVGLHGFSGTNTATKNLTTSLTSTSDPRIRFASWRGYLYFLNGYETKRWNLDTLADFGFSAPTGAIASSFPGGTGLTGLFHYAVTYGYGAAGELGESAFLQTTSTINPANQKVQIDLSTLTSVPAKGTVDVIYLYRSVDLSVVTLSSSYGAFPFYLIQTITRQADGTFPANVNDSTMAIPVPVKTLNPISVSPPTGCRHIAAHRSRIFLASNDQYPGRVWWSKNFEPESFNQAEDYADFAGQTGGSITAMIEFADQIVVFTEENMYGVANVDQDTPSFYIIAKGIGCIAADALRAGYGLLFWPSRGGIHVWDGAQGTVPELITDDLPITMRNLSTELHGGTRAIIHSRLYEIFFIDSDNTASNLSRYRYDLASKTWHKIQFYSSDVSLGPLLTYTMPLGHEDVGVRHPIYGKIQATGSYFHILVGEFKNGDDGNAITYTAGVHFGPSNKRVMSPLKLVAYSKGWVTANITYNFATSSWIGDTPGINRTWHDTATDYDLTVSNVGQTSSYSADITAQFSVTGAASGGTTGQKYLLAMYLDGNLMDQPLTRTN